MSTTNIEWTDRVWNPVTGCEKVSPGCKNCYAEGVALRFWGSQYPRIEMMTPASGESQTRPREFTDVQTHVDRLDQPLKWRKPSRVFVNSMSDLFHSDVPDAFIDQGFAVMALGRQHTFQVLTKRPDRMRDYATTMASDSAEYRERWDRAREWLREALFQRGDRRRGKSSAPDARREYVGVMMAHQRWPLPNVWLGVTVENQHFADGRIPLLLKTPAAVRFISAEPLLESIVLDNGETSWLTCTEKQRAREGDDCCMTFIDHGDHHFHGLDWVIVGGESGQRSRTFDLEWARSIVTQCQDAGVPCFVKQLGANPIRFDGDHVPFVDKKGGDPCEWPEDLRVRQFPEVRS